MGKAVQHPSPPGQAGHRLAVILLIQEKARFLPVLHIYGILHPVLHDDGPGALRDGNSLQRIPALVLFQALVGPQCHVVALIDAPDGLPVLGQDLVEQREDHRFEPLHPQRQGLGHQKVVEPVHRKTGEGICLPEDEPAAVGILPHHRFAVLPGIADPPLPEGGIKNVVGIPGNQTHPDLGGLADKARCV